MKLTFTRAALEDLRSVRAYTLETWGVEHEDRYLDRMWARFDSLRLDPARYRLRPTPFSPPSGPAQRLFQGPPAESKFLQ